MPSASVAFYGRRSRYSSSSSSSSDPKPTLDNHRHRRKSDTDNHRPHRDRHASSSSSSSSASSSSSSDHHHHHHHHRRHDRTPLLPESEPQKREKAGESSAQNIYNREVLRELGRRHSRSSELPEPVLLAKERLLQRLRGVSISGARETSSSHGNDFWVFDADWETNGFRDPPTSDALLIESPPEPNQQLAHEEAKKKPLGLTKETFSQLQHEVFIEHQSKASNECSICLENFVEGNELVILPCEHKFHTSCLYPWLRTCGDCPYCRSCIMFAT